MGRSIFGWSYPPGCSGPPDPADQICELCGKFVDDCVCPECPVCEAFGDPVCYEKHGLIRTEEQNKSLAEYEARMKEMDEENKKMEEQMSKDYMEERVIQAARKAWSTIEEEVIATSFGLEQGEVTAIVFKTTCLFDRGGDAEAVAFYESLSEEEKLRVEKLAFPYSYYC